MKLSVIDIDYILQQTTILWADLRNQHIFITGGTGFFGCWLLESLIHANKRFKLNMNAVVLTRNRAQFEKKCPHLFLEPSLSFHEGDIRDFKFPHKEFSYIIHAATDVVRSSNNDNSDDLFDTIVQGTKHVLEFARQCGAKNFLLTSSGAIYGKQPYDMTHIKEDYLYFCANVADNQSAYVRGKRKAEEICNEYANRFNLNIKIARCFAFVGPHLPLNSHFAIGNFIRDGLRGGPIIVNGNPQTYRSYLYAADLTIWLWTILLRGKTMHPYNVGSDAALTIYELANQISDCFIPQKNIHFKFPASSLPPERYVPDITRAKIELGLVPGVNLSQAIQATVNWHIYMDRK